MANIEKVKIILVDFLSREEGVKLEPYLCQANVPTIGIGATSYPDGRKVTMVDPPITKDEAEQMLLREVESYIKSVLKAVNSNCGTNQLAAMVSLAYNIGVTGFTGSTVCRAHNAGNFAAAARAFGLWNKYRPRAGEALQESKGLTARRLREAALYCTDDDAVAVRANIQNVEKESSLSQSPINMSGVAGIATGAATVASQIFDGAMPIIQQAKNFASILNINPVLVVGIVVVVAGGVSMYWRYMQRKQGWA